MQKIRTVKGTKDLFDNEILFHNFINDEFQTLCQSFNFRQISTPILEYSDVFTKSLGLSSDIVSKEMYNFIDQGKDNLVLRPEGTAAIARAIITNSLEQSNDNKFFYYGPMFRREKPQSGRLRQFHQVGIEYFGKVNYLSDLEVILLAEKFLNNLGIRKKLILQINSLGNSKSRNDYILALKNYLEKNIRSLSDTNKQRLEKNPLRILDSKDPNDEEIISKSPDMRDYLDKESRDLFENLIDSLDKLKINYKLNRYLVRGLDYYNHTAFEYVTDENKSQNAILAGGRYDGLIKSLGGGDLTGVGWAAGVERIVIKLSESLDSVESNTKNICFFSTNASLNIEVLKIMKNIKLPNSVKIDFINSGNLKKKLVKANKIGAFACIILGESEWELKKLIWKNLDTGNQKLINLNDIEEFLSNEF